eukprot:447030-Hanusia_phi.AAC.9
MDAKVEIADVIINEVRLHTSHYRHAGGDAEGEGGFSSPFSPLCFDLLPPHPSESFQHVASSAQGACDPSLFLHCSCLSAEAGHEQGGELIEVKGEWERERRRMREQREEEEAAMEGERRKMFELFQGLLAKEVEDRRRGHDGSTDLYFKLLQNSRKHENRDVNLEVASISE